MSNFENTNNEHVWFDIEKSQQRYEALLDSYMKIIQDKDSYIKQVDEELNNAKRERLELEDVHFHEIKKKDLL